MSAGALAHDLSNPQNVNALSSRTTATSPLIASADHAPLAAAALVTHNAINGSLRCHESSSIVQQNLNMQTSAATQNETQSAVIRATCALTSTPTHDVDTYFNDTLDNSSHGQAHDLKFTSAPALKVSEDTANAASTRAFTGPAFATSDVANVQAGSPNVIVNASNSKLLPPEKQRVTIWNRLQGRKIAGNAAPLPRNLSKYLREHPHCERYIDQDKATRVTVNRPILPTNAAPPVHIHPSPAMQQPAQFPHGLPQHPTHNGLIQSVTPTSAAAMAAATAAASAVLGSSASPGEYAMYAAAMAQQSQQTVQLLLQQQQQQNHRQQQQQQFHLHQHQQLQQQKLQQQQHFHQQHLQQQQLQQHLLQQHLAQQTAEQDKLQQLLRQQQQVPHQQLTPQQMSLGQQRHAVVEALRQQSSLQMSSSQPTFGLQGAQPSQTPSFDIQNSQSQQIRLQLSQTQHRTQVIQNNHGVAPELETHLQNNGSVFSAHSSSGGNSSQGLLASELASTQTSVLHSTTLQQLQYKLQNQHVLSAHSHCAHVGGQGQGKESGTSSAISPGPAPVAIQAASHEQLTEAQVQLSQRDAHVQSLLQPQAQILAPANVPSLSLVQGTAQATVQNFAQSHSQDQIANNHRANVHNDTSMWLQQQSLQQASTVDMSQQNNPVLERFSPCPAVENLSSFISSDHNDAPRSQAAIAVMSDNSISSAQNFERHEASAGSTDDLSRSNLEFGSELLTSHQIQFLTLHDDQKAENLDQIQANAAGLHSRDFVQSQQDEPVLVKQDDEFVLVATQRNSPSLAMSRDIGNLHESIKEDGSALLSRSGLVDMHGNDNQYNNASSDHFSQHSADRAEAVRVQLDSKSQGDISEVMSMNPENNNDRMTNANVSRGSSSDIAGNARACSLELADSIDRDLAAGDKLDNELFDDGSRLPVVQNDNRGALSPSENRFGISRRHRGASNVSGGLPPSRPSMDALSKSLQRDVSMEGMRIFREQSTEWLSRRLGSREPSFENSFLSHHHRDMSMSMEFGRPLRSHVSMEMQIPAPRSGTMVQHGALADELPPSNGALAMTPSFPSFDGNLTSELGVSAGTNNTMSTISDIHGNGPEIGSTPASSNGIGHIARSRMMVSKDDLMVDILSQQAERPYPGSLYRFASGGSIEDFRNAKTPYI